jgi:hypothetical protein
VRLFSLRHEFPTEWAKFQGQTPATNQRFELALNLRPQHYPFWSQGRLNRVSRVDILARSTESAVSTSVIVFDSADTKKGTLTKDASLGNLLRGSLTIDPSATPHGEWKLFFDSKAMADLWIAVAWSGE